MKIKAILVVAILLAFLSAMILSAANVHAAQFNTNTQLATLSATWIFANTINYTTGNLIVGNDYVTFPSGDTLRLIPAVGEISISIVDTVGVNSNTFYIQGSNQSVTYFYTLANGSAAVMNYSGTIFNDSFIASSSSTPWNYTFVPGYVPPEEDPPEEGGGGGGGGGGDGVVTTTNSTTTVNPTTTPEVTTNFLGLPVPTLESFGDEATRTYTGSSALINANRALFAGILFVLICGFFFFIIMSDDDRKKKNRGDDDE